MKPYFQINIEAKCLFMILFMYTSNKYQYSIYIVTRIYYIIGYNKNIVRGKYSKRQKVK